MKSLYSHLIKLKIQNLISIIKNLSYLKNLKIIQILGFLRLTKIIGFILYRKIDFKIAKNYELKFLNFKNLYIKDNINNFHSRHFNKNFLDNWLCGSNLLENFQIHYFDYINHLNYKQVDEILLNWDKNYNNHKKVSSHPYVISRRLINLCIYVQNNQLNTPYKIFNIIKRDYLILIFNLEFKHSNNHLTSNYTALYFVFNIFQNSPLKNIFNNFFLNHLYSQICIDGCHIEQTPMYHHLFLQDLILISEINKNNDNNPYYKYILKKVNDFNLKLNPGLEECSFFNDSNNYEFISSYDLNKFIKYNSLTENFKSSELFLNNHSGFHFVDKDKYKIVFFNSNIVAKYNPGHIHSSLMPYEIYICGLKKITNLGIKNYEEGLKRTMLRSDISKNSSYFGITSFGIYKSFRIFYYPEIVKHSFYKIQGGIYISYKYKFGLFKKYFYKRSFIISDQSFIVYECSNKLKFRSYINSENHIAISSKSKYNLNSYKFLKFKYFNIKSCLIRYKLTSINNKLSYKLDFNKFYEKKKNNIRNQI